MTIVNKNQIIIGFSTSAKFFSPVSMAVQLIEGTPFSHTYMILWDDKEQEYVVWHSFERGLEHLTLEQYYAKANVYAEFPLDLSDQQYNEIIEFLYSKEGVPYGYVQLIGMMVTRFATQLFKRKFKNPLADGYNTMVCSETVGDVLELMGVPVKKDLLEVEGPKMIFKLVSEICDAQGGSELIW